MKLVHIVLFNSQNNSQLKNCKPQITTCIHQCSPEKQNQYERKKEGARDRNMHKERFILRNWLTGIWELANPQSRQIDCILRHDFYVTVLRQNSFSRKPQSFVLKDIG